MAVLLALCTFVSTLLGGFVARRFHDRLHLFLGLAVGTLLGAALFDLMPEALTIAQSTGHPPIWVTGSAAAGFLAFHLLEKFLALHAKPEPEYGEAGHSHVGDLGALAVTVHSFFDGAAIGVAARVSSAVGVAVAGAVIAHDFSDGLNTSLMLRHSHPRKWLRWILLDAAAPVAGALATLVVRIPEATLAPLLGLFSGFFLYLGAAHLLPEAHHKHPGGSVVAATVVGFLALFAVSLVVPR